MVCNETCIPPVLKSQDTVDRFVINSLCKIPLALTTTKLLFPGCQSSFDGFDFLSSKKFESKLPLLNAVHIFYL